jgi:hypothetical protein
MMIFDHTLWSGRLMNSPYPSVMNTIPKMIGSRNIPVFLMNMPVAAESTLKVSTIANKYTPDKIGLAPSTT